MLVAPSSCLAPSNSCSYFVLACLDSPAPVTMVGCPAVLEPPTPSAPPSSSPRFRRPTVNSAAASLPPAHFLARSIHSSRAATSPSESRMCRGCCLCCSISSLPLLNLFSLRPEISDP
ncbi:hypothetical protein NL676_013475 [Syzygium grande]|nr:hypothetical protein NL676_013475 [Syzygium grande]